MVIDNEMVWTPITYRDVKMWASDFLDGVLIHIAEDSPVSLDLQFLKYIPGWKVQLQQGDMDGPSFRRRTVPTQRIRFFGEL